VASSENIIAPSGPSLKRSPKRAKEVFQVNMLSRRPNAVPMLLTEAKILSAINPISAALIGAGVNMLLTWWQMSATAEGKAALLIGWIGMIAGGGVLQVYASNLMRVIKSECEDQATNSA